MIDGTPGDSVMVPTDETMLQRVYVLNPAGSAPASGELSDFRIWVEDASSGDRVYKRIALSTERERDDG